MKSHWQPRQPRAFTLIELLVVIAIIAVLAALLLPTLVLAKKRAQRIQCVANLKQIGIAFQIFAHDHQGRFPMQVPKDEGGSLEYTTAGENLGGSGFFFSYRHFQPLANDLVTPKPLVCPADLTRTPADSFTTLRNSNLSYAIGISANYNDPSSVLSSDRNITNLWASLVTMMAYRNLSWTREVHFFKGNVLFADAHVEELNSVQIPLPTNTVLFLPTTPPAFPTNSGPTAIVSGSKPPPVSSSPASATSAQANTGSGTPPPPRTPMPLGNTMSSSGTLRAQGSNSLTSFSEAHAEETHGDAATNTAGLTAAPADEDDGGTPLLWLQGAAKTVVAKAGGWLWLLLLALLITAGAYVYSRWKKREIAKYQKNFGGRDAFSEDDE